MLLLFVKTPIKPWGLTPSMFQVGFWNDNSPFPDLWNPDLWTKTDLLTGFLERKNAQIGGRTVFRTSVRYLISNLT